MALGRWTSVRRAARLVALGVAGASLMAGCSSKIDTAKLLNPDPPGKMYAEADAYMSKGQWDNAAKKFEDLDRDHPYAPEARRSMVMAGFAYYKAGKYQEAIEPLASSVSVRPNLWYVHAWLVAALALTDRDAEAQQALNVFKQVHHARADLGWIAEYYQEEQYQNPTLQAASAEVLKGLQKAGLAGMLA